MDAIRVASLSPNGKSGDKEHNLAAARKGLEAAKAEGAGLALFSEWYLNHCVNEQAYRVAEPVPNGPLAREIIAAGKELEITVAIGIEELDPERGVVYNTHLLTGPQGYIGKHRKSHLMVGEMATHRAGSSLDVFDIGSCKVGVNICHENMYPELSRAQALQGMEVLLSPFGCGGSGEERVEPEVWLNDYHMACWRARAFDNGIFVVVSGGNGFPGPQFRTYCCIIDPWAEVIAHIEPEPDPEGLNMVVADLDPERFISRRTDRDYPLKKRRPEMYGKLTEAY